MWNLWMFLFVSVTSVLLQGGDCSVHSDDFKSEVKAMVAEILGEYESTIKHLQSEVTKLNSVVKHQHAKIQELDNKIATLTGEQANTEHNPVLDVQRGEAKTTEESQTDGNMGNVSYAKHASDEKQMNVGTIQRSVDRLDRGVLASRGLVENVAFCSYLDHELLHMAVGQTIKYNRVLLNDGDFYNIHTGVFTVPVTGVYLFTYHFNSYIGKTEIKLVVDDANMVDSVVDHWESPKQFLMGGNTAILHVTRGQAVWTETYYDNDQELSSEESFRKTTFSGVLLYTT